MTNRIRAYLRLKKYDYQYFYNTDHQYLLIDTGFRQGLALFAFLIRFDANKYIINTHTQVTGFKIKFNHTITII